MCENLSEDQIGQFKDAFKLFCVDDDGSICSKELGLILRSLGQNPTEPEVISIYLYIFFKASFFVCVVLKILENLIKSYEIF